MSLSQDQLDQLHNWYSAVNSGSQSLNLGGSTYGSLGVQNTDDSGNHYTPNSLIQYDPQHMHPGDSYYHVDPDTGQLTSKDYWDTGNFKLSDFDDLGQAALTVLSMYSMGAGLAAAGAGSAAGLGGSGFAAGGAAEGAIGGADALGGSGAFVGEGATSGIPAWDTAYTSAGGTLGGAGGAAGVGEEVDPMGYGGGDANTWGAGNTATSTAAGSPTDYGYTNGSDIQSDIATNTGTVPNGAINSGVTTTGGVSSPGPTVNGTTGTTTMPKPSIPPTGSGTSGNTGTGGSSGGSSGGLTLDNLIGLLTGAYGANQETKSANDMLDYLKQRQAINDNMYNPGSPEFNYLWDQMSRNDAAAGRNSQYGPRSVDLASRVAQLKMNANTQLTSNIARYMGDAYLAKANAGSNLTNMLPQLLGSGNGSLGNTSIIDIIKNLTSGNGNSSYDPGQSVGTGGYDTSDPNYVPWEPDYS